MPDLRSRPSGGPDATVIDLGLDRSPVPPDPRPRWSRGRWRRWWQRSPRRRPAGAVAALALAALAVSAPDPAPPMSPLALTAERGPGVQQFLVIDELLLVEHIGDGEPFRVSAHRLSTGDRLWSARGRLATQGTSSERVPILTTSTGGDETTVARDAATGAVVWSARGIVRPVPDAGVVVRIGPAQAPGHDDEVFTWYQDVAVADRDTGALRWSDHSEDGWQVAAGETAVALLERDGTVRVRDLLTGRTRAVGALPQAAPWFFTVAGDTLVTTPLDGSGALARGYSLDTLNPRWEVLVDSRDGVEVWHTSDYLQWSVGSATTLVDFRNGRTHNVPGGVYERPVLLDTAIVFPDGAGRIQEVVDRHTGRVFADATGWRLVEPGTGSPEQLLLSHRSPAGGTILARLDLTTGVVAYLGHVPATLSGCRSVDGGLICLRSSQQLELWRWR